MGQRSARSESGDRSSRPRPAPAAKPKRGLMQTVVPFPRALARGLAQVWSPRPGRRTEVVSTTNVGWATMATVLAQLASGEASPSAVVALARYDRRAAVRAAALEALGEMGDPRAIPALVSALQDPDWLVHTVACEELRRFGAAAVDQLVLALRHPTSGVRVAAAELLGAIGDPTAVSALVRALHDRSSEVVAHAAEALGVLGSESVVPALRERLYVADRDVQIAAAKALGRIGGAAAETALREAMADERWIVLADDDWDIHQAAVRALTHLQASRVNSAPEQPCDRQTPAATSVQPA
ncbi:MAG: HEAT repeat domain-containing protein [Chloroflexi bacterium]|nr:HEAT repeat domain-containing protein [Chloroflexota bacterium]